MAALGDMRKPSRKAPKARKARGQGHERRREILSAAKQLFLSEGYETVTTRQLAERVGLSQTGLYVYFKNKEEILEELRQSTFERLAKRLDDIVAERARGTAMLKRLLHGYIAFALANADEYQLTFMVTHASLKHHEEKNLDRPAEEQPVALQVFLIASGVLRPVDATATTQMLWGALHGLATLLITHPTFPWADHRHLIDSLVDTLVRGLKAPA